MDNKPISIALNVALHIGTLSAVFAYFWKDWLLIIQNFFRGIIKNQRSFEYNVFFPALVIGSIPAAVIGLLGHDIIEKKLHHPITIIITLSLVGVLLWWWDLKSPQTKKIKDLKFMDAFLIGLAQACALQFWLKSREDMTKAMKDYVELCERGGEAPFQELAKSAGLISPFAEGCLERVVNEARAELAV